MTHHSPLVRRAALAGALGAWALILPVPTQTQTGQSSPSPAPIVSPGPAAARMPTNVEEFDAYFKKVSNWGRWGASDELGTLNLITDAKRKQAATLVKVGQAVGLAHEIGSAHV